MPARLLILTCFVFALAAPPAAKAGRALTVAVATNALRPVQEVARAFGEAEGVEMRIVSGSTGKLYAQIIQGAPFDVFLAADSLRPELLEQKGLTKDGSRTTYTLGVLALWSPPGGIDLGARSLLKTLTNPAVGRIALPNPKTAPYGRAAFEAIESAGISGEVGGKLVFGESVSQAFGFARSGNADVAIVSLSTLYGTEGERVTLKSDLYSPIVQQGVVLADAPGSARRFMDFLTGPGGQEVFRRYGYMGLHEGVQKDGGKENNKPVSK
jgi:molybdate transport system substrate-binding protein